MCGPDGSAPAFGPQKGADPETVKRLEERLRELAVLARRSTGRDPSAEPMTGAAGGLAGGLWAFAGAELRSGAALVLDRLGFDSRVGEARAVFTGEGRLDAQTLQGKAVFEVATRCRQAGVPCYAVVGQDALDDFGKRLLSLEIAAAAPPHGRASPQDVERAARRLARRIAESRAATSG
jgi:glycerate kinase